MKIAIINGPNMNMLGIREPEIYGNKDYNYLVNMIKEYAKEKGIEVDFFQSNHEGELVDKIQWCLGNADGIVINPAAYTHTSIALLDAAKAVGLPLVEVHISEPSKRDKFRKTSYIGLAAQKTISGKGLDGYLEAIDFLMGKK